MQIRIELKHVKACKYCGEEDLSWYDTNGSEKYKLYKCFEGGDSHKFISDGEITHVILDTEKPHNCRGSRRTQTSTYSGDSTQR